MTFLYEDAAVISVLDRDLNPASSAPLRRIRNGIQGLLIQICLYFNQM
jgi:hypothetical protein